MVSSPIKYLLLFGTMLSGLLLAQNQVDDIVDRDPFDPNRGKEEEVVEEKVEEVVEVTPENVDFQLDGTILFSTRKMAIIKYRPDPSEMESPIAARGRNNRSSVKSRNLKGKSRNKPVRRPRNVKNQMKTKRLSENEKLQGYLVAKIESDHVVLTKGREQLTLRMFDGSKTDRGGSKKITKPAPKKKSNRKNKARPVAKDKKSSTKKPLPNTKKDKARPGGNTKNNNNARRPGTNRNNRKSDKQPVRRSVPKREF